MNINEELLKEVTRVKHEIESLRMFYLKDSISPEVFKRAFDKVHEYEQYINGILFAISLNNGEAIR